MVPKQLRATACNATSTAYVHTQARKQHPWWDGVGWGGVRRSWR